MLDNTNQDSGVVRESFLRYWYHYGINDDCYKKGSDGNFSGETGRKTYFFKRNF